MGWPSRNITLIYDCTEEEWIAQLDKLEAAMNAPDAYPHDHVRASPGPAMTPESESFWHQMWAAWGHDQ